MRSLLSTALATLTLCAAVLLPAGAASGAVWDPPAALSAVSAVATAATPTDSATPPGPVDPGTGETPAAKETRVDYAPYVRNLFAKKPLLCSSLLYANLDSSHRNCD